MAPPTAPTLSDLATEALAKANIQTTQANYASFLTRATSRWIEEVKNDIFQAGAASLNRRFRSLITTSYTVGVANQSEYAMPTDYEDSIDLYHIASTAAALTAQTGASTSVTLNASESRTAAQIEGQYIFMTSGTSAGQFRQVVGYNPTTKVVTVDSAWDASKTPVASDTYIIADNMQLAYRVPVMEYNSTKNLITTAQITLPPMWCDFGSRIKLLSVPTGSFGLAIRYFANIHKLDLSGAVMASLYQNWQQVLVQGLYAKLLQAIDDAKAETQFGVYRNMLQNLMAQENPWASAIDQVSVPWYYTPQRGSQGTSATALPPSTAMTAGK